MKHLRRLSLRYDDLTDKSAQSLGSLSELETLYLTGTHLSDAAIGDLARLGSLKEIFVRWTALSSDGADRLRRELPGCEVVYYPLVAEAK